jgi:hypothetical protein
MRVLHTKDEYISLKQAAQMSGYSADYVGQLIRSGKLPGKQIFSNVAWVTTEEALREYLKGGKKTEAVSRISLSSVRDAVFSSEGLSLTYKAVVWGAIALCAAFILFLGYVLAVSVDHRIEQKYLERLETVSV